MATGRPDSHRWPERLASANGPARMRLKEGSGERHRSPWSDESEILYRPQSIPGTPQRCVAMRDRSPDSF